MEILQQIWHGNIEMSDNRDRHKLNADDFCNLLRRCANTTVEQPESLGLGLYVIGVKTRTPDTAFNIIYQDLRSGDKYKDDRKRLQVQRVDLRTNKQYFYVGGYNAGDKVILVAFLTKTREINSSANNSSRWIDWDSFYKIYNDGINLWSKNDISYLGCTNDNIEFLRNALATRALDNYVPANVPTSGIAKTTQKIFFGAPGTGKSHNVKEETKGMSVHRTTFHPDTDYAAFVGSYKPTVVDGPVRDSNGRVVTGESEKRIIYEFVPQVFAEAYCEAWNEYLKPGNEKVNVCLLIEELNRGNCAQIFGDLFQLLDRRKETGFSEYSIEPSEDFAGYILSNVSNFKKYYETVRDYSDITDDGSKTIKAWSDNGNNKVRLSLPPNLSIVCTMNTSDQSLFPMDSAFKRRWEWEYVPIEYHKDQSQFLIKVDDSHAYSWTCFLKKINGTIYTQTKSEDKQMGNFFVHGDENMEVSCDQFISKVMYFLWSDICKDNPKARKAIFVCKDEPTEDGGSTDSNVRDFSFSDLFPADDTELTREDLLNGFMLNLGIPNISQECNTIDTTETIGENIAQRWEHSIYMDELIKYINNSTEEKFVKFKQTFQHEYKTHLNGFVVKPEFGGWISLARNKDVNLVCYGNGDVDKMRQIKDIHGDDIEKSLYIPNNKESNQRSVSRWMFTDKQGQAKLAGKKSLNREEEYKWFVENALKLYDKFKEYFTENDPAV